MHKQQKEWCEEIKSKFPEYFDGSFVLDVGSLDVNGTNRYLFSGGLYIGIDVLPGRGVDIVSIGHLFVAPSNCLFDVVLSTNAFEHDVFWYKTIPHVFNCLRHGGLMFFSCGYSHRVHGTSDVSPHDSATSRVNGPWASHYKNLSPPEILPLLNWSKCFSAYMMGTSGRDLRFWGIKR